MAEPNANKNLEGELSKYSLAAVKSWMKGSELESGGKLREACKSYSAAYQLANACYRTFRRELSALELKTIGQTLGVK